MTGNRTVLLLAFGTIVGCGSGVQPAGMTGIDDATKAKIVDELKKAGIDRAPKVIKDAGPHWTVALEGGGGAAKSERIAAPASGGDGQAVSEGGSQGAERAKPPERSPATVHTVNVLKSGGVQLLD